VVRWTPRNRSRESGTVEDRSRCGKGGSDFRAMWRCSGRPSSHAACCRSPSPCPRTGTGAPRDPRRVWAGTARRRPWVIAPPPSYSLPTRKGQAPQDANTPDQHRHRPDRQASEECERTEQDPQGPDDRTNRRTEPNRDHHEQRRLSGSDRQQQQRDEEILPVEPLSPAVDLPPEPG